MLSRPWPGFPVLQPSSATIQELGGCWTSEKAGTAHLASGSLETVALLSPSPGTILPSSKLCRTVPTILNTKEGSLRYHGH